MPLDEAAGLLHTHPAHLVRAFVTAFGIAPHRCLTTPRVGRARRLLLDGLPPGEVAVAAGFYDQSPLNRHFKKVVGHHPGPLRPHRRPRPLTRPPAAPAGTGAAGRGRVRSRWRPPGPNRGGGGARSPW
ncbi:AraC family transcriptional regulator [Streptomyces sp. SID8014]|nr:AraC family transcriptional regulator [Streptomyces sp. SID8014]